MVTSGIKTLGIVVPTRWEAGVVLRRFGFKRTGPSLYKSTVARRSILLCISGVGKEAARRAADRLAGAGATELVSMGFCGALVPELHVGDLVTDRIATVNQPVRTPEERLRIAQRANAVAVDMETQAVIESGTRRGVPIHILRVISDEWGDDLSRLFGTGGVFCAWTLALHLLNPAAWPLAWKLKKQSEAARRRLAEALVDFCSAVV